MEFVGSIAAINRIVRHLGQSIMSSSSEKKMMLKVKKNIQILGWARANMMNFLWIYWLPVRMQYLDF